MLTSRRLERDEQGKTYARSRRASSRRTSTKGRRAGGSSATSKSSKKAERTVRKTVKSAEKQAAKAEKARAAAEAQQKAAAKALKKANKLQKQKKKEATREKRQARQERRKKRRSAPRTKKPVRRLLAGRKSTRQGFDRRSSARARLLVVCCLGLISLGVVAAVIYVNSSAFGVTSVEVKGQNMATTAEIVEASEIVVDQNLLDVEPVEVAERVEAVPWVHTVSVDRKWNGSVVISVTERLAVAALESPSGFMLIDGEGRQLDQLPGTPTSHIPITGAEVSGVIGEDVSAEGLQATNFLASVSPAIRPLLTRIDLANGRLVAELDVEKIGQDVAHAGPTIEANFGTNHHLDEKMVSLETLLVRVDLTCATRIDLSSSSKPTVLRTPAATKLEKLSTGPVDC